MRSLGSIVIWVVAIGLLVALGVGLFKDASMTTSSPQAATKEVSTTGGRVIGLVVLFGLVVLVARGLVRR